MTRLLWTMGVMLAVLGGASMAQDEPAGDKFTGKVGERLPGPFPMYIVAAPQAEKAIDSKAEELPALTDTDKNMRDTARVGKLHDPITRIGLGPMLAVFTRGVPEGGSPVAQLLKGVEPILEKQRSFQPGAFLAILTMDDDLIKDEKAKDKFAAAKTFADSESFKRVIVGVDQAKSDRTALWSLPEEVDIAVYVVDKMKVTGAWLYTKDQAMTAENVNEILGVYTKQFPAPRGKRK